MRTDRQNRQRRNWMMWGVGGLIDLGMVVRMSISEWLQPPPTPLNDPDITIVASANMKGVFEVCGCPGKKAESIALRASFLRGVKDGWTGPSSGVLLLQGGNFVGAETESVPHTLEAFQSIGYDVIAVSDTDLEHEKLITGEADKRNLKLVYPIEMAPDSVPTIVTKKGIDIGFVGTAPPLDDDKAGLQWDALKRQLQELREKCQVVAVISHWPPAKYKEVLKNIGGDKYVDILFVSKEHRLPGLEPKEVRFDGGNRREPSRVEGVYIAHMPTYRSVLTMLKLWFRKDKIHVIEFTAGPVPPSLPKDDEVDQVVDKYYEARFEHLRQSSGIFEAATSAYMAPETCGQSKCHPNQYEQWLATPHAHAMLTLKEGGRLDNRCISCHSTRFRITKNVGPAEDIKVGVGVDCVTCHDFLADPEKASEHGKERPGKRPAALQEVNTLLCITCHDKENSPDFDADIYFPQIDHTQNFNSYELKRLLGVPPAMRNQGRR